MLGRDLIRHIILIVPQNISSFFSTLIQHLSKAKSLEKGDVLLPGIYIYAINSLFWIYPASEFARKGWRGRSDLIGDGDYEMSRFWYATPLSLLAFSKFGVLLSIVFIILTPFAFCYTGEHQPIFLLVLTGIYFSTPIVYSMAYVVGRYHAPAWFFLIVGISFLVNDGLIPAAISFVLVALTSTTVLLIATILVFWLSLTVLDYYAVTVLAPAFLVIFACLLFVFSKENGLGGLLGKITATFSAIGTVSKTSKYKRGKSPLHDFGITDVYFAGVFLFFYVGMVLITGELLLASIAACITYFTNVKLARFADTQTVVFFLFLACLIDASMYLDTWHGLLLLLPLAFFPFMYKAGTIGYLEPLPTLTPYSMMEITRKSSDFFSSAPEGSRILMCFPNPDGDYDRVFNGLSHNVELAVFSAYQNRCCLMPNYYILFKYNYPSAPEIWVSSRHKLEEIVSTWNITHLLIEKKLFAPEELRLSGPIDTYNDNNKLDKYSSKYHARAEWLLYDANKAKVGA